MLLHLLILHHVFLNANWSKINSEVELDDDSIRLEGITSRPLQGQSEHLANIQLGYDHIHLGRSLHFLLITLMIEFIKLLEVLLWVPKVDLMKRIFLSFGL